METVVAIPIRQILAAAQATQLVFIFLVFVGCLVLSIATSFRRNWPQWVTLFVLLVFTLVLTTITTEASADRQSIFDISAVPTLSGINAMKALLAGDLLVVAFLVALSGGSTASCFSPLYFLLPTLTILLLRHERPFIQAYIWGASLFFVLSAFIHRRYLTEKRDVLGYSEFKTVSAELPELAFANKLACTIISLICFFLSLYVSNRTANESPSHATMQQTALPLQCVVFL